MTDKSIYLVQPSYRKMDGSMIKEMPIFNYAINMPILSVCIPNNWSKRTCIEYFDTVDLHPSEHVIIMTSPGYDIAHAVELARHYKSLGKIVVFGSHTDDLSDRLMGDICDIVYYGYPNPQAIRTLLKNIEDDNIQTEYRWGFGVDFTFDYSVFNGYNLPFVPMMASTGCKNNCSYCCYPPVFKSRYRLRHVERVVDDLRQVAQFKKPVSFMDGNLYNNREYLLKLCNAITEARLGIRWGGQATIDIGDDPEVLDALRRAGCGLLFFGLETLEAQNERQLNKEMFPVARFEQQVMNVQRAGIPAGAYFILGLDHDTPATFDKVFQFINRTRIAVPFLHVLVPIPGTAIYDQLKSEERLLAQDFNEYLERNPEFSVPCSRPYYVPATMTTEEVERRFLKLNREVYQPMRILRRCFTFNVTLMVSFLKLNLEARRKYLAMERSYRRRFQRNTRRSDSIDFISPASEISHA